MDIGAPKLQDRKSPAPMKIIYDRGFKRGGRYSFMLIFSVVDSHLILPSPFFFIYSAVWQQACPGSDFLIALDKFRVQVLENFVKLRA